MSSKHSKAKRDERRALAEQLFSEVEAAETLPPDPDGQNDDRAEWARAAVIEFIGQTGVDDLDCAVGDLLADLMHLCDRVGVTFDNELENARGHYEEETYKAPMFKIERSYLGNWGDAEWTEDGKPLRFDSRQAAQQAIHEHVADTVESVRLGNMTTADEAIEFRVVQADDDDGIEPDRRQLG